jgi:hypothetical protein
MKTGECLPASPLKTVIGLAETKLVKTSMAARCPTATLPYTTILARDLKQVRSSRNDTG